MRLAALALAAMLLTGCVANQVAFDRGGFALAYADMKATYATAKLRIAYACRAGQLEPETCSALAQGARDIERVDAELRKSIMNPQAQVDWEKVSEYMRYAIAIAGALL